MPYLDIQQNHSAGAFTPGGRVNVWAQSGLTQNCQVFLGRQRVLRVSDEPPALFPGVNMRSSIAWEGKNSREPQGAGDGCQENRQLRSHSISWLTLDSRLARTALDWLTLSGVYKRFLARR